MLSEPRNRRCRLGRLYSALAASRQGIAAVEFALIVPIVAAMLVGLANYGLAMFDKMELVSAARAGAQLILVDASASTSDIQAAVVASTNLGISTSDVTVTESCECADGSAITCGDICADSSANRYFYTVAASENFTLLLLGTSITLTGTAVVRTQ